MKVDIYTTDPRGGNSVSPDRSRRRIEIRADENGYCLETCLLYKHGMDGFCTIPSGLTAELGGGTRFKRSRECKERGFRESD